jgi:hypothetical protein
VCDIYEIPPGVLESEAYAAIGARDPEAGPMMERMADHTNTVYAEELAVGPAPAAPAPALSLVELDLAEAEAEAFVGWYEEQEAAGQRRNPGFLRGRLCRQNGLHPRFPSPRPEWIAVTEWASPADAREDGDSDGVLARFRAAPGVQVAGLDYDLVTLKRPG